MNPLLTAKKLITLAQRSGASAAECLAITTTGTDVALRAGLLEQLETSQSAALGLRVFIGDSSAMVSGSVFSDEALGQLVERALAMARAAPPDPFNQIARADLLQIHRPDLDLVDSTMLDARALQDLAETAEGAALAVPGVQQSGGAYASNSLREITLVTSAGFTQSYQRSSSSFSVTAIAGTGTHMEREGDFSSACHRTDLADPALIGRQAGERAVRKLQPRKIPAQKLPVIFEAPVAASLLGHLASAINGAAIARGTSFLKHDMGKALFSQQVTIIDDPLRRRGLSSRPFDGEGLAPSRRLMIDHGQLTGWFLDLRSAKQLGLTPTGQAARGLSSPPSPSASNFYMEAGRLSLRELTASLSQGLLITDLIGNNLNMVTGDYSRGAAGFWIEGGEIAFPVSGITIAGNLREMFASLVPANDLIFRAGFNSPSCLVEGLTLAGS